MRRLLLKKGLIYLTVFLIIGLYSSGNAAVNGSLYQEGKELVAQGDTLKGLKVWLQAKGQLEEPDPRIAFSFIEVVTEANLSDYYEFGSLMYAWGMDASDAETYRQELDREVDRLKPLVANNRYLEWKRLVKAGDPAIYSEIRKYWKEVDPTPLTSHNERLIEHWERIAYARKHYDRGNDSVYGTDERGPLYVRLGSPDLTKRGTLQFDANMASSWISDIYASGLIAQGKRPDAAYGSHPYFIQLVREFYTVPEYEVWVYRDLQNTSADNTIFLFGTDGDGGNFSKIETVEDFIPNRAFSMGTLNGRLTGRGNPALEHIRPGLILQMMYYNQLATVDIFFGEMLNSIEFRATTTGIVSVSLGQEMKTLAHSDLQEARLSSPKETSRYDELMIDIPVQIHQYRLLDLNNRPYLASFMYTNPQQAFLIDYFNNYQAKVDTSAKNVSRSQREQEILKNYRLVHGVQVFGEAGSVLTQGRDEPVIVTSQSSQSTSLFTVPNVEEGTDQIFSAELHNYDSNSTYEGEDMPFPDELRGAGKHQVEQPEPLPTDRSKLVMGDLLLGYDYNEDSGNNEMFPFFVAHDRKIPEDKELVVHVEAYHLQPGADGITDFSLSYQILPVNFLGWTAERKEQFRLTLNEQTDVPRYRQNLQIKTQELEPGKYELKVTAVDNQNDRTAERTVRFEVTERG